MYRGRPFGFGRPPPPPPPPDFGRGGFVHYGGPRGGPFNFRGGGRFPGPAGPPRGGSPGFHPVPNCRNEEFGCPSPSSHPRGGSHGPHRGRGRGHNAGHQNTGKTKKPKVNKKDLPENNAFYCDVCDRGYKAEDKFKEHVDQHINCQVETCSYVASPKLVKLHYDCQHRTGLAKKIWSLESAEDIQKWRNERKKNFPTADNITKKKTARDAQQSRGEVLETKQFGKMRGRGRGQGRGRGRGQGRFNSKRKWDDQSNSESSNSRQMEVTPDEPEQKKTKMEAKPRNPTLDPLSYVLEENGASDDKPAETSAQPLKLHGGLGSLISSYGDITDSEEEEPAVESKSQVEKSTATSSQNITKATEPADQPKTSPNKPNEDLSMPQPKDSRMPRPENQKWKRPSQRNRNDRRNKPAWKNVRQPTLLEKLLAQEIRHERNVILQCIRYIVNNNFFGIGQKDAIDNSAPSGTEIAATNQEKFSCEKWEGESNASCDQVEAKEANMNELENEQTPSNEVGNDGICGAAPDEIETKFVGDDDVWEVGPAVAT